MVSAPVHAFKAFSLSKAVYASLWLLLKRIVQTMVFFSLRWPAQQYKPTKSFLYPKISKTFPSASFPNKRSQPFPKRYMLESSRLKEFADDNFEFDKNGRKFSKRVR